MLLCSCINRIRLEFKGNDAVRRLSRRYSINRIRLEFKVKKATTWAYDKFGINRIRLEFKDKVVEQINAADTVLIESDWNLK